MAHKSGPTQRDLDAANAEAKGYLERAAVLRDENRKLETELKSTKLEFADLKIRLAAAESSNQQMRGYIQRVQEDDVVREDLIAVGDPQGEQHMVPKRKQTQFPRPDDFTQPAHFDQFGMGMNDSERRRNAKHWVNY